MEAVLISIQSSETNLNNQSLLENRDSPLNAKEQIFAITYLY